MKKMIFVVWCAVLLLVGCSAVTDEALRADFNCGSRVVRLEILPGSNQDLVDELFVAVSKRCPLRERQVVIGASKGEVEIDEVAGQKVLVITPAQAGVNAMVKDFVDKPDSVIRLRVVRQIKLYFDQSTDQTSYSRFFADLIF